MFFVSAEIGNRMPELLPDFSPLFDLEVRVNIAPEETEQDLCFFDCRFLAKVSRTRFPRIACVKNGKESALLVQLLVGNATS
jgi:hypothetical protein